MEGPRMIQILGDLIADISMRLPQFPVQAKDIHRLSYLEVGPGKALSSLAYNW